MDRRTFSEARTRLVGMLARICLGGCLYGIALIGCSATAIPPPYTQDELKDLCERRGGRWHNGDPMRSYCEYKP